MRPDAGEDVVGTGGVVRARARWSEIATLYDDLAGSMSAAAWSDTAKLLVRLDGLVRTLEPLDEARRSAGSAAERTEWADVQSLARSVIDGHARVLRSAESARDAAARALARANVSRLEAARYRPGVAPDAFFTSRLV